MPTKKCTIVIDDEVYCRIAGLTPADNTSLWEKFGIFVDGYFFMPKFQLRVWDGKVRYYEKTGKTYTKLLPEIIPFLTAWRYEVELVDKRLPVPHIEQRVDEKLFAHRLTPDGNPVLLRPYQVTLVNSLLDEGSGFIICATGGGKTIMCSALAQVLLNHGLQTIVIVPSTDLVKQTAATFEMCGLDVGMYSGSSKDIDHPTVIATWQSLQNAPHNMKFFQCVIVDEAHGLKATVVKQIINDYGQHIAYRFAVTGTFPKPESDQYALRSSIGNVLGTVSAKWLIDNGYLSSIDIEAVEINEGRNVEQMPDYQSERAYITKKPERLELLANLIKMKAKDYGNTMVLVNTVAQGRELAELIEGAVFLYGESETELREQNYKQYAERDDVIVIATAGIASTGISIDRIFCLMLIDAGKSFIRCIQSIGRGLRRSGDKNHVHVCDVFSSMKHSRKHFKERKKHYIEAEYPVADTIKLRY